MNSLGITRIVDKERVIGLCAFDQPLHGPQHVCLCGNAHRILLIVGEDDHVLPPVAVSLVEENGHFLDIVNAALQLIGLSEVVDADEKGFATSSTVRVTESVTRRGAIAKALCLLRWAGREVRRGRP